MPNSSAQIYIARVREGYPFSVLSRICSLTATGEEIEQGEGKCVKQADVSSITCKVYSLGTNKDNESGTEITPAPSLNAATNIYDTLQTLGWPNDNHGYNFRHDVAASYVPNANEWYLLEYEVTQTDGTVIPIAVKPFTVPTQRN